MPDDDTSWMQDAKDFARKPVRSGSVYFDSAVTPDTDSPWLLSEPGAGRMLFGTQGNMREILPDKGWAVSEWGERDYWLDIEDSEVDDA